MELIRGLYLTGLLTRQLSRSVVTLGNFDGFHRGHQQLITQLCEHAQRLQAPTVVITFEPQPLEFFNPSHRKPRLMRFHEKWRFLIEQAVDYLVCLRFNAALAACSATDFVENILIRQLGMQAIIIGEDFRFGAQRAGNLELLQKLGRRHGFQVTPVAPFLLNGQRVSSTRVRQALQANDFALATQLLGRPYFLWGKVVHGDARGRQWGFPTANIHLTDKPVSVSGIYVVRVIGLGDRPLPAVASVGVRPMFSSKRVLLEVHLLDFNQDIYGRLLQVEFLHKLRDELIFSSTEELIAQIRTDIAQARQFLFLGRA